MAINKSEKIHILGLAAVERLQFAGMTAIAKGDDDAANSIADQLLALAQETSDKVVSEMATLAHAGIASGQLKTASAALASVNDQIATATNCFSLAARIAQEGEKNLTLPFIAGKLASTLDFLSTLQKTLQDTVENLNDAKGIKDLLVDFESAEKALDVLRKKAEGLAS